MLHEAASAVYPEQGCHEEREVDRPQHNLVVLNSMTIAAFCKLLDAVIMRRSIAKRAGSKNRQREAWNVCP